MESFDPGKINPRPVFVKFFRYDARHRVVVNKQKLKGEGISTSEFLSHCFEPKYYLYCGNAPVMLLQFLWF